MNGLDARQLHVVAVLGFCGLVSAADNWFVSPALPAIAAGLSVLPATAAVLLTAYMLPYGALQPVCGALGDRFGRLRLLRVIVLGLAACTFLCAVAPTLPLLVLARVATGCFAAGIISVSQAFVSDAVGQKRRAAGVGLLMGITFTGQGLSAGLGGILTDLVGWRAAFAAFGVLAALAWGLLFTLRAPRRSESAAPAVSGMPVGEVAASRLPVGEAAACKRPSAAVAVLAPCLSAPALGSAPRLSPGGFFRGAWRTFFGQGRAVFLLACSTGVLFLGVYGFMGTFLAERCGLTTAQAGLVMMLYGVLCLVGGAVSGRLGARRGLPHVVFIGEVSGVLSVLALLAAQLTGSWVPALLAAGLLGLGYILVQPTLVSLSMDVDPARAGLCTGLIGFGVFAGGGVGSALGGVLLGAGGYPLLWGVAAAGLITQFAVSGRALGSCGAAARGR